MILSVKYLPLKFEWIVNIAELNNYLQNFNQFPINIHDVAKLNHSPALCTIVFKNYHNQIISFRCTVIEVWDLKYGKAAVFSYIRVHAFEQLKERKFALSKCNLERKIL